MTNPLPADLQSKIEKEAEEYWMIKRQYNHHPKHYYIEGATAYAEENERLRKALGIVANWELPITGKVWPSGNPMSYGHCYGSNGERDFMISIAKTALGQQGKGGEDHG